MLKIEEAFYYKMVLILKYKKGKTRIDNHEFNTFVVDIVKHMICMEYNENLFLPDGSFNTGKLVPYLVYTDDKYGTTYEVTPSNGYIIFTTLLPEFASLEAIISEMSSIFDILATKYPMLVSKERLIPTSYGSLHPTSQGMILHSETNEHWNRFILSNQTDGQLSKIQGMPFIWSVQELDNVIHQVLTCDGSVRSEEYINRDLSTIFVDVYDIYKQPHNTLQFKAMNLRDIRGHNRITFSQLVISQHLGLKPCISRIMDGSSFIELSENMANISAKTKKSDMIFKVYSIDFDELPTLEYVNVWDESTHDLLYIVGIITAVTTSIDEIKESEDCDSDNAPIAKKIKNKGKGKGKGKGKKKTTKLVKKKVVKKLIDEFSDDEEEKEYTVAENEPEPEDETAAEPQQQQPQQENISTRKSLLIANDVDVNKKRNDICVLCSAPLFGEVFVIQHTGTRKCVGVCEYCLYSTLYNHTLGECVVWFTIYPRTMVKAINDPDLFEAMKIDKYTHDPVALQRGLQLIAKSKSRVIYQRYSGEEYINNPVNHLCRGIMPKLHEDSARWQFMFNGVNEDVNYTLYLINDVMFRSTDYELLEHDDKVSRYIGLGGLLTY